MQKAGKSTRVFTCECKVKLELYRILICEVTFPTLFEGPEKSMPINCNAIAINYICVSKTYD